MDRFSDCVSIEFLEMKLVKLFRCIFVSRFCSLVFKRRETKNLEKMEWSVMDELLFLRFEKRANSGWNPTAKIGSSVCSKIEIKCSVLCLDLEERGVSL